MPDIQPTFTCFDDAMEFIERRVLAQQPGWRAVMLVHGLLIAASGFPYAHAWVEDGGVAWDCGIIDGQRGYYGLPVDEWRTFRRVERCTRYTLAQLMIENERSQTYGPWDPVYRAACHRPGTAREVIGVVGVMPPGSLRLLG